MAVCQNLVPLVNIKIAGKWMFIPLKIVLIGIDPYPPHRLIFAQPQIPPLPTKVSEFEAVEFDGVGNLDGIIPCRWDRKGINYPAWEFVT